MTNSSHKKNINDEYANLSINDDDGLILEVQPDSNPKDDCSLFWWGVF